jgi:hypothetical protein
MGENLICEGNRCVTEEFRKNWEYTFKRYWVAHTSKNPGVQKLSLCRKVSDHYEAVLDNTIIDPETVFQVVESTDYSPEALEFLQQFNTSA